MAGKSSNMWFADFVAISNDLDWRPKKLRQVFISIPPICVSPYKLRALTEDKVISPSFEPPPRLDETWFDSKIHPAHVPHIGFPAAAKSLSFFQMWSNVFEWKGHGSWFRTSSIFRTLTNYSHRCRFTTGEDDTVSPVHVLSSSNFESETVSNWVAAFSNGCFMFSKRSLWVSGKRGGIERTCNANTPTLIISKVMINLTNQVSVNLERSETLLTHL